MKTFLYEEHQALNARMAPFGDWEMPIQYSGIIDEHLHTRQSAGLFDICHMGEFILKGPQALADLSKLMTAKLSVLKPGRCKYGFMLNQDGGVIDDLITYCLAEDEYMVVVNSATLVDDRDWIKSHLSADTVFTDISDKTAKIDLQGPLAAEVLQPLCADNLSELKYFQFILTNVAGVDLVVSRTGYTGEYGYELYLASDKAVQIWQKLLENDKVKPIGLGARDTLRLEVGLPLYGHELGLDKTPVASGMVFAIDTNKEFIGKDKVMQDIEKGCEQQLVGLKLPSRQSARPGQKITFNEQEVGEITSGSFGPSLGFAIAFAYVRKDCSQLGTELVIETGRKQLLATVVKTAFYSDGTARK